MCNNCSVYICAMYPRQYKHQSRGSNNSRVLRAASFWSYQRLTSLVKYFGLIKAVDLTNDDASAVVMLAPRIWNWYLSSMYTPSNNTSSPYKSNKSLTRTREQRIINKWNHLQTAANKNGKIWVWTNKNRFFFLSPNRHTKLSWKEKESRGTRGDKESCRTTTHALST